MSMRYALTICQKENIALTTY